jgi:hypothetical protein
MVRRAAALAFALMLSPATLDAQDIVLTVNVPSADVYKGPSNVTPVVGHVSGGTAVPVLRNLGSWVRVPWPAAPDGVAYIHVTMGRLTSANGAVPNSNGSPQRSSAAAPGRAPASSSSAPASAVTPPGPAKPHERVAVSTQQGSTAITHVLGFGGVVESRGIVGATARTWRDNRLGIQIGFTRDSMTNDATASRVTSTQIEPAVVYGLFDFVSDYFWIRPYAGSGLSFHHQTLHQSAPVAANTSDNGAGFHVFGGSEVTFAGAPRFALSLEVGYRRFSTPFPGFTGDRMTASLSGHWYVK